jgi:hypothetical protein
MKEQQYMRDSCCLVTSATRIVNGIYRLFALAYDVMADGYDIDAIGRRSTKVLGCAVGVLISITLAVVLVNQLFGQPYREHLYNRELLLNRSKTYLKTTACTDHETRAILGDFNECETSRRIVSHDPRKLAFYDVLSDFSICKHGSCLYGLQESAWNIAKYIIAIAVVLYMTGIVQLILHLNNRNIASGMLPLAKTKTDFSQFYEQQQQPQVLAPPPKG